ncbi:hypothetical protein ACFL0C_00685 [Patescibacteria group bacterium]
MNEYKTKTNKQKLYKYICMFSFFLFASCLLLQVYISNTTALKGKDFRQYQQKKSELEKEIALLQFEDANLSSLEYVENKALSMGFSPLTEPLYPIISPALASLNTP